MENNNGGKIQKYLYNQITFILALVGVGGFIWGIYSYITNPIHKFDMQIQEITINYGNLTKQMQNLKDNDLHFLQLKTDEIVKNQQAILVEIAKLQTLLGQHVKEK